jgi:translation initiation factor 4B
MSDAGSERGGRRQFEQGDGKVRDFSNWERKGPLLPAATPATSLQEGGRQGSRDGPGFRKTSPSWGEGRSQEGSRPPRREFQEKPIIERAPTAAELDNQWRAKMRPDAPAKSPTPSRETSNPPSPAPATVAATRPKLNLQKRTVSEADPGLSPAASTVDSKASPFGAARPVDTLARDQEIEEKRQLALRQRREAEEKLKAEKAEEKRLAKEAKEKVVVEQETKEAEAPKPQENGSETPQPSKNFEILRRTSEPANDMVAPEDAEDEEAAGEGAVAEDKAVKPKEIVRDTPKAQANGAWRNKDPKKEPKKELKSEPKSDPKTATNLEEDGWSTVSKNAKQRNNRRGNQAARAIAS